MKKRMKFPKEFSLRKSEVRRLRGRPQTRHIDHVEVDAKI